MSTMIRFYVKTRRERTTTCCSERKTITVYTLCNIKIRVNTRMKIKKKKSEENNPKITLKSIPGGAVEMEKEKKSEKRQFRTERNQI